MVAFFKFFLDLTSLVKPRTQVFFCVLVDIVIINPLLNLLDWNVGHIVPLVDLLQLLEFAQGLRLASHFFTLRMLGLRSECLSRDDHVGSFATFLLLLRDQAVLYQVGIQVFSLLSPSLTSIISLGVLFENSTVEGLALLRIDKGVVVDVVESLASQPLSNQVQIVLLGIRRHFHLPRDRIQIKLHRLQLVQGGQ